MTTIPTVRKAYRLGVSQVRANFRGIIGQVEFMSDVVILTEHKRDRAVLIPLDLALELGIPVVPPPKTQEQVARRAPPPPSGPKRGPGRPRRESVEAEAQRARELEELRQSLLAKVPVLPREFEFEAVADPTVDDEEK